MFDLRLKALSGEVRWHSLAGGSSHTWGQILRAKKLMPLPVCSHYFGLVIEMGALHFGLLPPRLRVIWTLTPRQL